MTSAQSEDPLVPSFSFTTDGLPAHERFDVWSAQFTPLFEARLDSEHREQFWGRCVGYLLGDISMTIGAFAAPLCERTRSTIARNPIDHYLVTTKTSSPSCIEAGKRQTEMGVGDLCVLDLGRTARAWEKTFGEGIVLMLPRELLNDRLPGLDLHGVTLRHDSAAGAILAHHIDALKRNLPRMKMQESIPLEQGTVALLAACLAPSADRIEQADGPLSQVLLARATSHIDACLDSPDLSPETLCEALKVSRTHLYRVFRGEGGVTRYILKRRLQRAYRLLRDPRNIGVTIGGIAYQCGFTNQAHFTRVFRAEYGIRPSDARDPTTGGPARTIDFGSSFSSESN